MRLNAGLVLKLDWCFLVGSFSVVNNMSWNRVRISRRTSLRIIGVGAASPFLFGAPFGCTLLGERQDLEAPLRGLAGGPVGSLAGNFADFSPMNRSEITSKQTEFTGDEIGRAHV